jgi:tetratricopeptide (TPR) repeat protein
LRQLIRAFPNSYLCPQGKVKLADTYFLQRDYDNAIELYRAIMKEYPSLSNMPLVLLRMAQISSRRGDWGAKKKYLSSIKAKYPQSSEMKFVKILESYGDFFTIQVGAFTSEVNALALVDNLKKKYDAYVVADTNGGYSIHKVRVGHFKERYEVEKVASELSDQGYPACIYP